MAVLRSDTRPIRTSEDVVAVRQAGARVGGRGRVQPGRSDEDRDRRERAGAQHRHPRRRRHVRLESLNDGNRRGLRLIFEDQGPGIADIEQALTDGYTTGNGLGLGLGGRGG